MDIIDLDERRKINDFLDDLTDFFGGEQVEVTLTLPKNCLEAITEDDLTVEQALYLELFSDKLSVLLAQFCQQFGDRTFDVAAELVDAVFQMIPGVHDATAEKGGN